MRILQALVLEANGCSRVSTVVTCEPQAITVPQLLREPNVPGAGPAVDVAGNISVVAAAQLLLH